MLALIILGFAVFLVVKTFKKNNQNSTTKANTAKKIVALTILGVAIYLVINTLTSDGVKSFYCFSNGKCITVWKKTDGEKYIIFGKYESRKTPLDNYIKISNLNSDYVDVIFVNSNKLLIDVEDNAKAVQKSSNGLMELYRDNKTLNDSLYTYFDGKYRRYKEDVDYISINIKENYAIDKSGKKLN